MPQTGTREAKASGKPRAGPARLPGADHIKAALLTAFQIQALYDKTGNQVTLWATITDDTPRTIQALLNDPAKRAWDAKQ